MVCCVYIRWKIQIMVGSHTVLLDFNFCVETLMVRFSRCFGSMCNRIFVKMQFMSNGFFNNCFIYEQNVLLFIFF